MKIKEIYFLIGILSLFLTLRIISGIKANDWAFFLWFCFFNLALLTFALYTENNFLLSTVLTSSFILSGVYTIDLISFTFSGKLIFGVANHLPYANILDQITTYYHIFLLAIPIYILHKKKTFHPKSWIFSSLSLLIVSLITAYIFKSNINCAITACDIGIFNFIYNIKPTWTPLVLFNWLATTIILFIPTNYLFHYLINRKK